MRLVYHYSVFTMLTDMDMKKCNCFIQVECALRRCTKWPIGRIDPGMGSYVLPWFCPGSLTKVRWKDPGHMAIICCGTPSASGDSARYVYT